MYENLNVEQQLVMYLSRLAEEVDVDRVKQILEKKIDWFLVMKYGYKNKVIYLIYSNLKQLNLETSVPKCIRILLEDSGYCNVIRNTRKLTELNEIRLALQSENIDFLPVKGGYMIDNVYNNRFARVTNDMDALILKKDIKKIDLFLKDKGYVVGEWDADINDVIPPTAEKRILYKTKMYNLLPYVKKGDGLRSGQIVFDMSHALDFTLDTAPVEEMIRESIECNGVKELRPEHFFVHMCCHHYREASHIEWIRIGKDLTIMKFCDVRTFVKKKMDADTLEKAVTFAKKYKLEKAVYFTLYFLDILYHDGYEESVLQQLGIEDTEFLFKFSEDGKNLLNTRKKDFWASIFDENNREEVMDCNPIYDAVN